MEPIKSHVMRTRKVHQITVAALHILQHRAYDHYNLTCSKVGQTPLDYEAWCDKRKHNCPQFQYWATTLELEICILTFVRSLRESNFAMYTRYRIRNCSLFQIIQTMPAGYQCIREIWQIFTKHIQMFTGSSSQAISQYKKSREFSLQSPLAKHINKIMPGR